MKDQTSLRSFDSTANRAATPASFDDLSSKSGELIQRVLRGDHEAFYELIRPFLRAVYMAAYSILNNQADAEDVSQEAILKAFRALGSFRAESKFSTWLIQITINEARLRIRKDRSIMYVSIDDDLGADKRDYIPRDIADWRNVPSEALEQMELREALTSALESLAPKYREVLVMRDVNHFSIEETVRILGITAANVKTRLLRARLQMRDALALVIGENWSDGGMEFEKGGRA